MAHEIVLPKSGNTVEECIIKRWNKHLGDAIKIDDVLCEVETDKTTIDVVSTANGIVRHVFHQEEDIVKVLEPLAIIGDAEEDITAYITTHNVKESIPHSNTDIKEPNDVSQSRSTNAASHIEAHTTNDETQMLRFSPRARQYLHHKGLNPSNFLRYFSFASFYNGQKNLVEEKNLISFFNTRASMSPVAVQAMIEKDVTLDLEYGSGIAGRIRIEDVELLKNAQKTTEETQKEIHTISQNIPHGMDGVQEYTRTPVIGVQKIISDRMMNSLQTTAQLSLTMQSCAYNIKQVREHFKTKNKAFTINDILLYIVSRVLSKNLWANSIFTENTILSYKDINLGCAVHTPKGLFVPVITQASEKTLEEISSQMKQLSQACKEGTISPKHLQGGTFTVTNLGAIGVQTFTPILNAPQTGILGVGSIDTKAVETAEGNYVFTPYLNLSFTFDHRAYGGMDAALLLKSCSDAIASTTLDTLE